MFHFNLKIRYQLVHSIHKSNFSSPTRKWFRRRNNRWSLGQKKKKGEPDGEEKTFFPFISFRVCK